LPRTWLNFGKKGSNSPGIFDSDRGGAGGRKKNLENNTDWYIFVSVKAM
jgi:hypothetical protein